MAADLTGTWKLVAWRRVAQDGGGVSYPLGEDLEGLLIYTANGRMSVVLGKAGRAPLDTADPVGGDAQARAEAYSGCLAYYGTYDVGDDEVVHHVEFALFPNWSGAEQARAYELEGDRLTLRTPPMQTAAGTVVNELEWSREA